MMTSGRRKRPTIVATATSVALVALLLPIGHEPASAQGPEVLAVVLEVAKAIKKEQEEAARWKKVDDIQEHVESISRRLSRIESGLQLLLEQVQRLSEKIDQRFDKERHEKILAEMGKIRRNLRLWTLDPENYRREIESALGTLQGAVEFSRLTSSYGGYLYVAAAMPYERVMFLLLDRDPVAWEDTFLSYADYFLQSREVDVEGSIGAAYRATRLRMLFIETEHAKNPSGWCRVSDKILECDPRSNRWVEYPALRKWKGDLATGYGWVRGEPLKKGRGGRAGSRCEGGSSGGGDHHLVTPAEPGEDPSLIDEFHMNAETPPDWRSEDYWRKAKDELPASRQHSCFKPLDTTREEYQELATVTVPLLEDALNTAYNVEALARVWAQGPS
jgi:hypothetical protein